MHLYIYTTQAYGFMDVFFVEKEGPVCAIRVSLLAIWKSIKQLPVLNIKWSHCKFLQQHCLCILGQNVLVMMKYS